MTSIGRLLLFCALAIVCAQTLAQPASRRIRGDVTVIDGLKLSVVTRTGENVTIDLDDKYVVTAVIPVDIAVIKPGAYVGTASTPEPMAASARSRCSYFQNQDGAAAKVTTRGTCSRAA